MLTYAAGLLLGFSLAAPPGPMNGLMASRSLSSAKKGALTGAGAMTADLMFMLLSFEASRLLGSYKEFFYGAGAAAMAYLALATIRKKSETAEATAGTPYLEGLLAGITNPFQVSWWLTVGTGFVSAFGVQGVLGLFSALAIWILVFPLAVSSAGRLWGPKAWSAVRWASVLVMSAFSVYFFLLTVGTLWSRRHAKNRSAVMTWAATFYNDGRGFPMEKVVLGFSGLKVSALGMGAWQAAGREWGADVEDQKIAEALVRASKLGVNLFDTAEAYGNGHSEEVVGKAIREIGRENVVIATKVYGAHLHHDELIKAADASAKRLGVKEIDLYQVHWPDPWEQVPLRETMRALEELYKAGKIRAIGVSNFAVRDLKEAREHLSVVDISSNQVRYNLLQRKVEDEVLPYCKREGIAVLAWSPLGQGALTGKYSLENKPSDDVRRGNRLFSDKNLKESAKLLEVLKNVGSAHGKTPAQVALRWLIEKGTIPIPGAKNSAQAEENVGATNFALTQGEIEELDMAARSAHIEYFP